MYASSMTGPRVHEVSCLYLDSCMALPNSVLSVSDREGDVYEVDRYFVGRTGSPDLVVVMQLPGLQSRYARYAWDEISSSVLVASSS